MPCFIFGCFCILESFLLAVKGWAPGGLDGKGILINVKTVEFSSLEGHLSLLTRQSYWFGIVVWNVFSLLWCRGLLSYRLVYLKMRICEALGLQMIVVWKLSLMAALYMGKYFLENLNLTISVLLYASVTSCQSTSGAAKLIITVLSTFSFSKFYFWWQIKPLKRGMKFIGPLDRIYVSLCVTATLELIPSHWDDDKINSPSLSGGVKLLLSVTSSGLWVISLQQWDTLFLKSLFCRTFWKWILLSNATTCDCRVTCVNKPSSCGICRGRRGPFLTKQVTRWQCDISNQSCPHPKQTFIHCSNITIAFLTTCWRMWET